MAQIYETYIHPQDRPAFVFSLSGEQVPNILTAYSCSTWGQEHFNRLADTIEAHGPKFVVCIFENDRVSYRGRPSKQEMETMSTGLRFLQHSNLRIEMRTLAIKLYAELDYDLEAMYGHAEQNARSGAGTETAATDG